MAVTICFFDSIIANLKLILIPDCRSASANKTKVDKCKVSDTLQANNAFIVRVILSPIKPKPLALSLVITFFRFLILISA